MEGSRSAFGRSLSVACEQGRCDRNTVLNRNLTRLFPQEDHSEIEGCLVRDLLDVRHEVIVGRSNDFNLADINFIINSVCTS